MSYASDIADGIFDEDVLLWFLDRRQEEIERLATLPPEIRAKAAKVYQMVYKVAGVDRPKAIILTQDDFEAVEACTDPLGRYVDVRLSESGYPNILLMGLPLVGDWL